MSRSLLASLFAATAIVLAAPAAQASTITYDLSLSPTFYGPYGGTGYFTVNTPALGTSPYDTPTNGVAEGGNGNLIAMSFTIAGETFNLTNASNAGVGFNQNSNDTAEIINSIVYTGTIGSTMVTLSLSSGGFDYTFTDSNPNGSYADSSGGLITATLTATPLPATLPLFAGGLGMFGLFGRRRKQKALNALAA
jgi:hypothetical protein